jgi:hypothetical protein
VSARQVTISVTAEGAGDLHVLPTLVETAAFDAMRRETRLDVDVLSPLQSRRPAGSSFEDWMVGVERRERAELFVVHQDADKAGRAAILQGRWASWLERAADASRWVIAVPDPTTEAWMLADHETLAAVLALPHNSVVETIGHRTDTGAGRNPKQIVAELLEEAGRIHGWTLRFASVAASWSERASPERLTQRSRSYASFTRDLAAALRRSLVGRHDG